MNIMKAIDMLDLWINQQPVDPDDLVEAAWLLYGSGYAGALPGRYGRAIEYILNYRGEEFDEEPGWASERNPAGPLSGTRLGL